MLDNVTIDQTQESLEELVKSKKITKETYGRAKVAKEYIEKKYKNKKLEAEIQKEEWSHILKKMTEFQLSELEKNQIKKEILQKETQQKRRLKKKATVYDYEPFAIVGRGAFGEVRVCRNLLSNRIVAIKKLYKEEMHKKNQVIHVRTEKDFLRSAVHPHVVELISSFQDDKHLYLEMEFCVGGDLMSQLIKKEIFTEYEAKFYCAQLISALEYIHGKNCIHRDLKPDNVLIDKYGYIKLSDFGLSKVFEKNIYTNYLGEDGKVVIDKNDLAEVMKNPQSPRALTTLSKLRKKRILAHSTVGTPDYIAPEVFSEKGYGPEVDWWSVGTILFEMVIGFPPFYSDTPKETCKKIVNWKKFLKFPNNVKVSNEVKDLMTSLINDVDKRLGYNGASEIKNHPWFRGIDWNNLKLLKPPFVPKILNDFDFKYFETFKEKPDRPFYNNEKQMNKNVNRDAVFLDFSFQKDTHSMNLSQIFDQIEESKQLKRRDKSVGISIKNNISSSEKTHTNIQSNFTNISDESNMMISKDKSKTSLKVLRIDERDNLNIKSNNSSANNVNMYSNSGNNGNNSNNDDNNIGRNNIYESGLNRDNHYNKEVSNPEINNHKIVPKDIKSNNTILKINIKPNSPNTRKNEINNNSSILNSPRSSKMNLKTGQLQVNPNTKSINKIINKQDYETINVEDKKSAQSELKQQTNNNNCELNQLNQLNDNNKNINNQMYLMNSTNINKIINSQKVLNKLSPQSKCNINNNITNVNKETQEKKLIYDRKIVNSPNQLSASTASLNINVNAISSKSPIHANNFNNKFKLSPICKEIKCEYTNNSPVTIPTNKINNYDNSNENKINVSVSSKEYTDDNAGKTKVKTFKLNTNKNKEITTTNTTNNTNNCNMNNIVSVNNKSTKDLNASNSPKLRDLANSTRSNFLDNHNESNVISTQYGDLKLSKNSKFTQPLVTLKKS